MPPEYLCVFSGLVPVQLQIPMLIIGKCVVLILKLSEISKSIKAPASHETSPLSSFYRAVFVLGVYVTPLTWDTIIQKSSKAYSKLTEKSITSFFDPSFNLFLTHLLSPSSIPLPGTLLFLPLMRGRLISVVSPSVALLLPCLSRGRTVTLWWQWQRSSIRGHWCSELQGSGGYSDLHKPSIFHLNDEDFLRAKAKL